MLDAYIIDAIREEEQRQDDDRPRLRIERDAPSEERLPLRDEPYPSEDPEVEPLVVPLRPEMGDPQTETAA